MRVHMYTYFIHTLQYYAIICYDIFYSIIIYYIILYYVPAEKCLLNFPRSSPSASSSPPASRR